MKQKFTLKKPMPPIWMMYPNISQFSIGWRMGYGESYKWDLLDWLKTLKLEEKKKYDLMFPKPKFWHEDDNYYDLILFWQKKGAMKYTINQLIKQNSISELEYIFFWKPNINSIDKSCLGQWQPSSFEVDIDGYICAEQYMMSEKAKLFEDRQIEKQIMQTSNPKEMKALGQKVKGISKN